MCAWNVLLPCVALTVLTSDPPPPSPRRMLFATTMFESAVQPEKPHDGRPSNPTPPPPPETAVTLRRIASPLELSPIEFPPPEKAVESLTATGATVAMAVDPAPVELAAMFSTSGLPLVPIARRPYASLDPSCDRRRWLTVSPFPPATARVQPPE